MSGSFAERLETIPASLIEGFVRSALGRDDIRVRAGNNPSQLAFLSANATRIVVSGRFYWSRCCFGRTEVTCL
jgi:hypothetical protein